MLLFDFHPRFAVAKNLRMKQLIWQVLHHCIVLGLTTPARMIFTVSTLCPAGPVRCSAQLRGPGRRLQGGCSDFTQTLHI